MGLMPYSLVSEALDLTQMVMDIQKQLKLTYLIIPNNVFSTTSLIMPKFQLPTCFLDLIRPIFLQTSEKIFTDDTKQIRNSPAV